MKPTHASPDGMGAARILVAEDDSINRRVMLAMLRKLGHEADAARNGREAIEMLAAAHYDVVLMDCQMPELDGIEAVRILRGPDSTSRNPRVRIVALTANVQLADRERCLAVGMDDYMMKPVPLETLSAVLKRWLPAASPPGAEAGPVGALSAEVAVTAETDAIQATTEVDAARALTEAGVVPDTESGTTEAAESFRVDDLLQRLGDDRELAQAVLEAFVADIPAKVHELAGVLDGSDAALVARLAHGVRGAAENFSAPQLAGVAAVIEQRALSGSLEAVRGEGTRLERALLDLLDSIRAQGWERRVA